MISTNSLLPLDLQCLLKLTQTWENEKHQKRKVGPLKSADVVVQCEDSLLCSSTMKEVQ